MGSGFQIDRIAANCKTEYTGLTAVKQLRFDIDSDGGYHLRKRLRAKYRNEIFLFEPTYPTRNLTVLLRQIIVYFNWRIIFHFVYEKGIVFFQLFVLLQLGSGWATLEKPCSLPWL